MHVLDGYKSYIGAALMAAGAALDALGYVELGVALRNFGTAVLGLGLAHKLAKQ